MISKTASSWGGVGEKVGKTLPKSAVMMEEGVEVREMVECGEIFSVVDAAHKG